MREVKSQKQSREIKKKKIEKNRAKAIYRKSQFSMDREVSRFKSYQMELLRGIHSKVTLMDREAIEHLSNIQRLPRWIKKLLRSYRDKFSKTSIDQNCITTIEKGRSKGSIDSLAVERYRETVKIAQKQFFKEEKNTDMNAIKHAT